MKKKLAEKDLPAEVRTEAEREVKRLAQMHPSSAEYHVITTYLDWIINLPWTETTEDCIDIKQARKILNQDHYDLDKVKRRILEYLAVRKLNPQVKGPILCLAGPPGWARPPWDAPSPGPWAASSCASPWAGCATRPR